MRALDQERRQQPPPFAGTRQLAREARVHRAHAAADVAHAALEAPSYIGIEESRCDAPRERAAALFAHAAGEIVALVERGQQTRHVVGIVLEIRIEAHHTEAAHVIEARADGGRAAEVAPHGEHADAHVRRRATAQQREAVVARRVVHEE